VAQANCSPNLITGFGSIHGVAKRPTASRLWLPPSAGRTTSQRGCRSPQSTQLFEKCPLKPLQSLSNFPIISKRNGRAARDQDLPAGNFGDFNLTGIAIEFCRHLFADPGPAMGIVDVGRRNPAAVAQFSNCRRHQGLGLHALSRSARFNVESMFGFLWSPPVSAEAVSCLIAPPSTVPMGHQGMILCNLDRFDGFDAGNPGGG